MVHLELEVPDGGIRHRGEVHLVEQTGQEAEGGGQVGDWFGVESGQDDLETVIEHVDVVTVVGVHQDVHEGEQEGGRVETESFREVSNHNQLLEVGETVLLSKNVSMMIV